MNSIPRSGDIDIVGSGNTPSVREADTIARIMRPDCAVELRSSSWHWAVPEHDRRLLLSRAAGMVGVDGDPKAAVRLGPRASGLGPQASSFGPWASGLLYLLRACEPSSARRPIGGNQGRCRALQGVAGPWRALEGLAGPCRPLKPGPGSAEERHGCPKPLRVLSGQIN
jgi:hypothetical protein